MRSDSLQCAIQFGANGIDDNDDPETRRFMKSEQHCGVTMPSVDMTKALAELTSFMEVGSVTKDD
jgi:hypothetical protein